MQKFLKHLVHEYRELGQASVELVVLVVDDAHALVVGVGGGHHVRMLW